MRKIFLQGRIISTTGDGSLKFNSPWLQGVVMLTSCMQPCQGEPGAPHPHWYDSPSWGRPFSRRPVSDSPECQVHGLWGRCESQLWPTSHHWGGSLGDLWIPPHLLHVGLKNFQSSFSLCPPDCQFQHPIMWPCPEKDGLLSNGSAQREEEETSHPHVGFPKQIMILVQEPICEPIVTHSCRPNCIF
jgi:hypothetical protein